MKPKGEARRRRVQALRRAGPTWGVGRDTRSAQSPLAPGPSSARHEVGGTPGRGCKPTDPSQDICNGSSVLLRVWRRSGAVADPICISKHLLVAASLSRGALQSGGVTEQTPARAPPPAPGPRRWLALPICGTRRSTRLCPPRPSRPSSRAAETLVRGLQGAPPTGPMAGR